MILNGNQRGGAADLARHLRKDENEHIEIFELRGFASDDLEAAFQETYAISRATSLSLNPPSNEEVATEYFIDAIDRVEKKLGLTDQPRAIVFHEKQGRRHAHAVWSRIDDQEMKAVNLPYTKLKLRDISRELFIERGWKMPQGLANSQERNPKNFTLAEWQQAKRGGKDPRAIKTDFQDAWAISDSKAAFINALEERGYKTARGDRRGFVAVDYQGEIYSIPKWTNVKTKQVRERLGSEKELPSLDDVKSEIAREMLSKFEGFENKLTAQAKEQETAFEKKRVVMVETHRAERQALDDKITQRQVHENQNRQARFRKGLKGLWDRMNGSYGRTRKQNEHEALAAQTRDRVEKDTLVFRQLEQRQRLQQYIVQSQRQYCAEKLKIEKDAKVYKEMQPSGLCQSQQELTACKSQEAKESFEP